jgi:hypothetical protein
VKAEDFLLLVILVCLTLMVWIGKWRDDDISERVDVLELIHAPAERP